MTEKSKQLSNATQNPTSLKKTLSDPNIHKSQICKYKSVFIMVNKLGQPKTWPDI